MSDINDDPLWGPSTNSPFILTRTGKLVDEKNLETLDLIRLSEVKSKKIQWLWNPYIPQNKVILIEGDPGVGKSWLTMKLAAAISKGEALPFSVICAEGNVLIFSAEDDPADAIKPRLEKLEANMENIYVYPKPDEFSEEFIEKVEHTIRKKRPTLVILDPLQCYMGSKNMNSANETRSVLAPLAEIAANYGCTVLVVRHLKKGFDKSIYKGMGSIDIFGAVRSVLLVGCNQQDKSQRAIIHTKSNYSEMGDTLGYTINEGKFEWTGKSELTEKDLIGFGLDKPEERSQLQEAKDYILEELKDGPIQSDEMLENAKKLGISKRTLDRAKNQLGVLSVKPGGDWHWSLPDKANQDCQQLGLENLAPLPKDHH